MAFVFHVNVQPISNGAVYLQDSAKLEKAEILQMTVDHLKSLHSKGKCNFFSSQSYNFDELYC